MTGSHPRVDVVVLQYGGWRDTVVCLESLLRLQYPALRIIVVDNASPDDSWEQLQSWAQGHQPPTAVEHSLASLFSPPAAKPLSYCAISQKVALTTGTKPGSHPLVFIRADYNRGYSAGNNIGIQYSLKCNEAAYVWLLNNDTLVLPETLTRLLDYFGPSTAKIGIVGAKILYYDHPNRIQCLGGATYNSWLAYVRQVGNGHLDDGSLTRQAHPPVDYISGASMLVAVPFIEDVGLLAEEYFLYYEEMDWCIRGKERGWAITYNPEAVVYHKEGATIGKGSDQQKGEFSDFYSIRNKLLLTEKHYGLLHLLTVYFSLLLTGFNRLRRGQFSRIGMILWIICHSTANFEGYKKSTR